MFVGDREQNTDISEYLALDHTTVHLKVSPAPGKQHLYVIQIDPSQVEVEVEVEVNQCANIFYES